jgi:hypothetical protein
MAARHLLAHDRGEAWWAVRGSNSRKRAVPCWFFLSIWNVQVPQRSSPTVQQQWTKGADRTARRQYPEDAIELHGSPEIPFATT